MGRDAYKVTYERTEIPRNYDFFDNVLEHFENEDGIIYIDRDEWKEYLEENPKFGRKFPKEIAAVNKLLSGIECFVELSIA
jgi:hypothetical protein